MNPRAPSIRASSPNAVGDPYPGHPAHPVPAVFLMTNSFETGGSERQFVALAQALDPAAFDVHLGCIMRKGELYGQFHSVPAFRLGGSMYSIRSFKSRLRLALHLRKRKVAVAHAFDFYTNLLLIPTARFARVPVVIASQRQLGDLLRPNQIRAQAAAFGLADVVICNSHAAASRLMKQGIAERKIAVIYNGLSASFFSSRPPAFPRSSGAPRIGMIARMNTRVKNHRLFLAAAARLRDQYPHLEFLLAGDGPLRPELEGLAKELNLDRVRFVGECQDVRGFLASVDISVLPSESESLSNSILESMAAGVPVAASSVGGNPELLGNDRGLLFMPGNDQELAHRIEQLIGDENMARRLAANASNFVRAHCTIEQMRSRHEELYGELLQKKHRSSARVYSTVAAEQSRTRPLHVAIVCASLRYVGGQSAQAELLLREWKNDPLVHAKLIPIDPALPPPISWVERFPGLRTLVREPFYLWSLWKGLRDADIAHIFSASYWSFLIAPAPAWLIASVLRRKKALIHYHSGEARDHLKRFPSARYVLERVDELVVPSQYLVDVFREFQLSARAVPNAIDLSQFAFRLRDPLRPRLLCTRGFHPYYSVDVIIRAFSQVQKLFPDAQLDLVGSGPQERDLRELVRKLQLTGVNFPGVVSRQEIARAYDRADIFINASWLDNMPVSVLEAFASGTPVITTAPEGIRYMVEHERTGLLSPTGDPEALASNVIRVLQESTLAAKLALNAHEECRRYRWSTVREQWLEVYRALGFPLQPAAPVQGVGEAAAPAVR